MATKFAGSSGNNQWLRQAGESMQLLLEGGKNSKSNLNQKPSLGIQKVIVMVAFFVLMAPEH
jgi:hypothetical protein